jgi:hypothetical protein
MPSGSGRKPKKNVKVVAVVTANGIEGSFSPEPRRPLIAHLQIHSNEVNFSDMPMKYDPNPPSQPEPYDASEDNIFNSRAEVIEVVEKEEEVVVEEKSDAPVTAVATTPSANPLPAFVRSDLMVQYREGLSTHKLPSSVEIACFWCAHVFDGMPCIIPEREEKGVYRVYGNFCCPECAVSYLLNENMDPHVRWERMALLNRIYSCNGRERIFPAPVRESLKLFGGPMSIEVYRATIREGKVRVDIHNPPMVSILGSIDTKPIDFFDTTIKASLNTLVAEKNTVKAEEGLRLKRSKPLKDPNSTLDAVMNIQIKGKGVKN